jgi:hypothetical protein
MLPQYGSNEITEDLQLYGYSRMDIDEPSPMLDSIPESPATYGPVVSWPATSGPATCGPGTSGPAGSDVGQNTAVSEPLMVRPRRSSAPVVDQRARGRPLVYQLDGACMYRKEYVRRIVAGIIAGVIPPDADITVRNDIYKALREMIHTAIYARQPATFIPLIKMYAWLNELYGESKISRASRRATIIKMSPDDMAPYVIDAAEAI